MYAIYVKSARENEKENDGVGAEGWQNVHEHDKGGNGAKDPGNQVWHAKLPLLN